MSKNSLLKTAAFLCQLINGAFILVLVILTIVFIHFQVDRDFYNGWHADKPIKGNSIKFQKVIGEELSEEDVIYMTDWNTSSLYFNYLRFAGIILLMYLAIKQFQDVLNLETFKTTNVQAFHRIGIYCLIISGLSWITMWVFWQLSRKWFSY